MYTRNPFWDWENDVSGAATGIVAITLILLAGILLTVFFVLLKEIVRIYQDRALNSSTLTAKLLWIALAVFLALIVYACYPAWTDASAYIISWGFLAFVIFVEGCDLLAPRLALADTDDGLLLGEEAP